MITETTTITQELQSEIAQVLDISILNLKFIGYSQNFTYQVADESGDKILRITSDLHRTKSQIKAELDWIDFLKAGGINACAAISNEKGKRIVSIATPADILHCVLFEKAGGNPINAGNLNDELYYLHGALIGKIHRLSHTCPESILQNRFNWQDNRLFNSDIQNYLPDGIKESISGIAQVLIKEILELPQTKSTYGIIHFDLHYDNFFKQGNDLWLFDFDNCSNGYCINDIAKALWNSVFSYHRKAEYANKSPFMDFALTGQILERVWAPFWKGYCSENDIEAGWFDQIPLFFEIIHLKEFVHHYRHRVPYRNEELRNIFAIEQKQIEQRIVPVSFSFTTGKAI